MATGVARHLVKVAAATPCRPVKPPMVCTVCGRVVTRFSVTCGCFLKQRTLHTFPRLICLCNGVMYNYLHTMQKSPKLLKPVGPVPTPLLHNLLVWGLTSGADIYWEDIVGLNSVIFNSLCTAVTPALLFLLVKQQDKMANEVVCKNMTTIAFGRWLFEDIWIWQLEISLHKRQYIITFQLEHSHNGKFSTTLL